MLVTDGHESWVGDKAELEAALAARKWTVDYGADSALEALGTVYREPPGDPEDPGREYTALCGEVETILEHNATVDADTAGLPEFRFIDYADRWLYTG